MKPPNNHNWDAMLQKYHKFQRKPKITDELKVALQTIWEELPQEHVSKAVVPDCHMAVAANGGHSKHLQ